jgi:wyosine [tRNA(Phe)-imidazoG37] synthetase (radical SAM superfamily)
MVEESRYSFGPVPSRRLGRSLGVNNIPAKVCTYSCVYCQVGRTTQLECGRRVFYEPRDIVKDVQDRLAGATAASERVDYLAFVPDGEPTVDINLGTTIAMLKELGLPIGVITNGSLLWRDDVRKELALADWVSVKVDAVSEHAWRRIARPHKSLQLPVMLEGILEFASAFKGRLVTETMLVKGLNDTDECARDTADYVSKVAPSKAYLSIPIRPPAEGWVTSSLGEDVLARVYSLFSQRVPVVECLIGYEGDSFALTGDFEADLLSITAVHPMRQEAVASLLSRAGFSWEVVGNLIARGDLVEVEHEGHTFYLRRFAKG